MNLTHQTISKGQQELIGSLLLSGKSLGYLSRTMTGLPNA